MRMKRSENWSGERQTAGERDKMDSSPPASGFWKALRQVYGHTREQRCRVRDGSGMTASEGNSLHNNG